MPHPPTRVSQRLFWRAIRAGLTSAGAQGLFKVVVAAWCRVDTPWVRYKRGGHG